MEGAFLRVLTNYLNPYPISISRLKDPGCRSTRCRRTGMQSRKPMNVHERKERDAEVLKGVNQLRRIKDFLNRMPHYLCEQNRITRSISDYAKVHYCVVARDHFPENESEDFPISTATRTLCDCCKTREAQARRWMRSRASNGFQSKARTSLFVTKASVFQG